MKKITPYFAILILIFTYSCQTTDDIINEEQNTLSIDEKAETSTKRIEEGEESPKELLLDIKITDQNTVSKIETNVLTEEEAKNLLSPEMNAALSFFRQRGFSDSDLIYEFGSLYSPDIINSADYLSKIEISHPDNNTYKNMKADWYDCLLRSVGMDAVIELINGKVTKAIAVKAIRKVVGRTLGWIGAALAVYEYGSCMNYY